MSDRLSSAELEVQQVELLPARTVLSLFSIGAGKGGQGGTPGAGGTGTGGVGINFGNMVFGGTQTNIMGMGFNGAPGTHNPGR
jgi:hypothetical protein